MDTLRSIGKQSGESVESVRSIVMSVSVCVCLFVCPRSYLRNYTSRVHQIFLLRVTYGRGSVLLWRRSDTLCTSGFVADVIAARKPKLLSVAPN